MELRRYGTLIFKGMAMGAADVVPGVSGGTIAFITGVYEELLESLRSLNPAAFGKLFREGFGAFWTHIHGSFLLPLVIGIGISIVTLAKAISYLLVHSPVLLWSFFFGLILASIFLVSKSVRKWSVPVVIGLLVGAAVSYWITEIDTVADANTGLGYIFLCGMIAICAMILPGISGSFILLLLGAYGLIIDTINTARGAVTGGEWGELFDPLKILGTFAVGALLGLVAFSHVLTWLFKKCHDITIAVLIGFLVGSLNKVWPWKEVLSTRIKHAGREDQSVVPLIQKNVSPFNYDTINTVEASELHWTVKEPFLMWAIVLAVAGFALIWILEKFAPDAVEAD